MHISENPPPPPISVDVIWGKNIKGGWEKDADVNKEERGKINGKSSFKSKNKSRRTQIKVKGYVRCNITNIGEGEKHHFRTGGGGGIWFSDY